MLTGDEAIDAAFSSTPAATRASSVSTGDEAIDSAFASSNGTSSSPIKTEPNPLSETAHGVGTLFDVIRNVGRAFSDEPTVTYGSPESYASRFSKPLETTQKDEIDPKEAARRALPKLGDLPVVQKVLNAVSQPSTDPKEAARLAAQNTPFGETMKQDVLGPGIDIANAAGNVAAVSSPLRLLKGPISTELDAQSVVDKAAGSQSMGAAGASTNLAQTSPTIKTAIQDAARKNGGAVNRDAMLAHLEADKNGVQLMKGQAMRDPIQFSAEQNSTDPRIAARLKQQNEQLTDRLDEIRRNAAPGSVHNDVIQNGQTVVDALKAYDEPIKADIQAKYKALTDANGGSIPIDTGAFLYNVDRALKKQYLTSSVPSGAQELLSSLRGGEPLDFEGFEAARSRLAEAQRAGGSEGAAAKIIRDQLEQLPLSPEAANLKTLADSARSAAKARFNALDRDPAYQAAVNDVESGVKRGEPSPIADRFLDKYVLGTAPKVNVDTLLSKLDDEAKGSVVSHVLNQVRNAAIGKTGQVLPSGFSGAMQKLEPKIQSLLPSPTIDDLQSLGKTINDVKVAPPGNHVNFSKSGVIVNAANAAKGAGEHLLDVKTGGLYGLGKKILTSDKATNDKFVTEALKPGAGIDVLEARP